MLPLLMSHSHLAPPLPPLSLHVLKLDLLISHLTHRAPPSVLPSPPCLGSILLMTGRWPDVHGVSCTATIVSHYTRRGDYRVHAAAVKGTGASSSYTHTFVKGHRCRAGEDE